MLRARRISQATGAPCRLAALGRPGRAGHRAQQGRLVPAHRALSRAGSRQRDRARAGRDHGAPQQRAARLETGWALFVEAARAPRPLIRARRFPRRCRGSWMRSAAPHSKPRAPTSRAATSSRCCGCRRRKRRRAPRARCSMHPRVEKVDWREQLGAFVERNRSLPWPARRRGHRNRLARRRARR